MLDLRTNIGLDESDKKREHSIISIQACDRPYLRHSSVNYTLFRLNKHEHVGLSLAAIRVSGL